jgi:methionyl-tRNA formyltransferase
MSSLRIVFAGTPEFSVTPLKALIESGHEVIAVYTQPDRPAGRGRKLTPSLIKKVALDNGIPVFQPVNFKSAHDVETLAALGADLMVVVAYGLILPQVVLNTPRLGCINIHASLLPRWRGAAPIQRAIQAGDKETGIAIMQMEAGLDTGPIWLSRNISIEPGMTGGELHDRLAKMGAAALLSTLPLLLEDKIQPVPQANIGVTYAHKLNKNEAHVDWHQSASEIHCLICAFNPWPVAFSHMDSEKVRLWKSRVSDLQSNASPGTVIAENPEGIFISCADGVIQLLELQLPGKRKLTAKEFLNAHSLLGKILS